MGAGYRPHTGTCSGQQDDPLGQARLRIPSQVQRPALHKPSGRGETKENLTQRFFLSAILSLSRSFLHYLSYTFHKTLTRSRVRAPRAPAGLIPRGPSSKIAPSDPRTERIQPPRRLLPSTKITWSPKRDTCQRRAKGLGMGEVHISRDKNLSSFCWKC